VRTARSRLKAPGISWRPAVRAIGYREPALAVKHRPSG